MALRSPERKPLAVEPGWPEAGGRRVLFLIDAANWLERRILAGWVERTRPPEIEPADYELIPIPSSRRGRRALDPRLEDALAAGGDPLLAPLRVVWRAQTRDGRPSVHFTDLLMFHDPREPGPLRGAWILRRQPDRCQIAAGEPAPVSQVRARWLEAGGADGGLTTGLAEFVARQAALALERTERRLRGLRYKVPRLVHEEILGRPAFRGALAQLARQTGSDPADLERDAARYLKEIAAAHSPTVIDLVARLIHLLYTQGYEEALSYDREQLAGVASLIQRHPVVFLPSHRSNLDHLVLQYALHENGLPPNHTAGGINMNFFLIGPLLKRSGLFFIRRTFKDNPTYKLVLSSYIDYLIEKRFTLEWYIEGGRSRSGKLLPPRFGLLANVVDAFRRGKSDDVFLVPVSIAYDQIQDVGSYADEQVGGVKQKESFSWFVGVVRALRKRYGRIYIRFGDAISLQSYLGPPEPNGAPDSDERALDLQKLAFEVSVRINQVTPITPTSLVTLAILGNGDRALSVAETRDALRNLVPYVQRRKLPVTADLEHLETEDGVRQTLLALKENGVISCYDEGPEAVYAIGPDQQLAAAFYRNSVVHFFLAGAIVELALLRAAEGRTHDPTAEFWDEAMRLRDLLKFEFFFPEKEIFRAQIQEELAFREPDWERQLALGSDGILPLVRNFVPSSAHRVLRPFLEAYRVVSDQLADSDPVAPIDESRLLTECLKLGKQYQLQRKIHSSASVSQVLFQTALRVAENRGLLEPEGADLRDRRTAFADEIHDAVRRCDAVDALAAGRRAGVSG